MKYIKLIYKMRNNYLKLLSYIMQNVNYFYTKDYYYYYYLYFLHHFYFLYKY